MNDDETNQLFGLQSAAVMEQQLPQDAIQPDEADDNDESNGKEAEPTTHLQLTEERRSWLVNRACDRIDECRSKMGLVFGQGMAKPGSWAWDRQIAQMQYDGVFDWRKEAGGVFLENNWSLNVPKRFIRLMAAKMSADLLGTEPYFACMPEKSDNATLSKQVERFVQKEVGDSNLTEILREAQRVALCCGERVVKSTHVVDETEFKGPAVVAVDEAGNPITTPSGDYIYPEDDFIPDDQAEGQIRLKKEPSFSYLDPQQKGLKFDRVENLSQKIVHKKGLEAGGISCEDFLYDITQPSLDKSDIQVHVYDDTLEALKMTWGDKTENQRFMLGNSGALSQASQPIEQQGEQEGDSHNREMVNVHEVYIRCDADEDGKEEWIFMVLDFKNKESIYEEYLGNLKMKQPPFQLIRGVESVPGRAYGNGVYKMFEHKNLFIDVQFNRVALKASKEGSVTFIHKDGTEETKAGLSITIGDKKSYTIPATKATEFNKNSPPIFRVNLNEVDEYAIELMEKMIQSGMLEFGIISAADGSEADLNSSRTAYGIKNIERTGNLLQRMSEDMQAKDIEGCLRIVTDIVLENMNAEEMAYQPDSDELVKLNRDEIRTLGRDVRLLLTKIRSEEAIQSSTQVTALLDAYYSRPKWLQKIVRPEYVNQLKMLEVQDADERLKEPTDEQIQEEANATAQAAAQPPTETISAKLSDFPPEVLPQVLEKYFGISYTPPTDAMGNPVVAPPSNTTNAQPPAKPPAPVRNPINPQAPQAVAGMPQ